MSGEIAIMLVLAIAAALLSAALLPKPIDSGSSQRCSSLDGLRGYLAFFVVLHHSAYWFHYLCTGVWVYPSRLVVHLGQSCVMLFFMATGFLFWSKLIRSEREPIDWTRLYVSRVLRLGPLFWCAVALLFAVVAVQSQWQLMEPPLAVAKQICCWLTFNVLGVCDINGIDETWRIVAGVTWTLKYEWFFYLSLPALGLLVGKRPPIGYLILSIAVVGACFLTAPSPFHIGGFFGGMAAAYLVRSKSLCNWATTKLATLLTVGAIGITVSFYGTAYATVPLILLSLAFALIACGNDLFGALTNSAARKLGEISYSIYLLHGLMLYTVFQFGMGREAAGKMTELEHWFLIVGMTPVLVGVCGLTFHKIELPAMNLTPAVTTYVRDTFAWTVRRAVVLKGRGVEAGGSSIHEPKDAAGKAPTPEVCRV